jgi:hypothetical protein
MLPQTREKNAQVSNVHGSNAQGSYSGLFWAVILALMVAQIAAFWMLCSQQVRNAELRDATAHQERLALTKCMSSSKSTVSGCVARAAALQGASRNTVLAAGDKALQGAGAAPGANGALPVSFTVR